MGQAHEEGGGASRLPDGGRGRAVRRAGEGVAARARLTVLGLVASSEYEVISRTSVSAVRMCACTEGGRGGRRVCVRV